eukprot:8075832-Alexandrium_andersonii.AAC.1
MKRLSKSSCCVDFTSMDLSKTVQPMNPNCSFKKRTSSGNTCPPRARARPNSRWGAALRVRTSFATTVNVPETALGWKNRP